LEEGGTAAWLDAVERELAEHAVAVALARAETVSLISARAGEAGAAGPFPAARIALAGEFDRGILGRSAAEAEAWYRRVLNENRAADRAAGRALAGPQRSDLEILFAEKDMPAALSSTGEQKALLIGLILAHAELVAETSGMTPVLLLDEVAAHLDPARREALFGRLTGLGYQSFLTGTDPGIFSALGGEAEVFQLSGHGLERLA
jgi:DNA replication and repair protein RecF